MVVLGLRSRAVGRWDSADLWTVALAPVDGWQVLLGYSRECCSFRLVVWPPGPLVGSPAFAAGFDDVGELDSVAALVDVCRECRVGPFAAGGAVDWLAEVGLADELRGVAGGGGDGGGQASVKGWRSLVGR